MIRRSIREHDKITGNNDFLGLIPLVVGNVDLIFTKGDLMKVNHTITKYKVLMFPITVI
ncbi:hypothetical protein MKW98_013408 [Papaver atlanticum]|uniref:Uncharacterized protein n=1 Tax=Papaver atlanticum TaxID=357466 RepID=A0AAD4STT6_9MAGN|nr:hypothetical protein MKW98_013408 [Papaver atlanticum]